ncbi:MAG: hypothetical protein J5725_09100 [Bacteroidales bacterium]|nr:hypothetical protein [Bacteroidales bacterium]
MDNVKMVRKVCKIVFWGILGIEIPYILFFFIYTSIAMSKLKTINGKSVFDVTAILDISKDRITMESETYNKKEFIEYDCIIDSTYYITIVKGGKISNTKLQNCLRFANQPIPSRENRFNYDLTSPAPFPLDGFTTPYFAIFNVFTLPLKEIDKINVFVNGKIISKEYINDNMVSYFVESRSTTFSFNNINKFDMEFIYAEISDPLPANIFFTIDADKNLYIGCASTKTGTPKTLKEILNNCSLPQNRED